MTRGTSTAAHVIPIDAGAVRVRLSKEAVITTLIDQGFIKKETASYTKQGQESYSELDTSLLDSSGIVTLAKKPSSVPRLSQSELYPVRHAFSREHLTALRLLKVAVGRTERALKALVDGDAITSDSEMQKVQVLLPELFCCRSLGDGFGTIINAIMSSFESLRGEPLNATQLRALNQAFSVLKDKPFLSVDEADQQIEQLQVANLNPHPPEIMEFLSSAEGIR